MASPCFLVAYSDEKHQGTNQQRYNGLLEIWQWVEISSPRSLAAPGPHAAAAALALPDFSPAQMDLPHQSFFYPF